MDSHRIHRTGVVRSGDHRHHEEHHHRSEHHFQGHIYRHSTRTTRAKPPAKKPPVRPRPRARQSGAAGMADEANHFEPETHEPDEAGDTKAVAASGDKRDANADSEKRDGDQSRQQGRRERGPLPKFRMARQSGAQPDACQQALAMGLQGVAELFGSRAPAQAVEVTEAMARLLLGAACLPTRGRPTNTQLVLNASRAALMRLGPRGHALTMSVVKQILVAAQRQVWGGASRPPPSEQAGDTLALLPLLVLNATRSRLPGQHGAALDRLQLLLRTRGL